MFGGKNVMRKKEFVKFYAEYNKIEDFSQASEEVNNFIEMMKEALTLYPKIVFRGFGTFEVRETRKRMIVDPRGNGEIIRTKPRKYVKFKQSINLEANLKEEIF